MQKFRLNRFWLASALVVFCAAAPLLAQEEELAEEEEALALAAQTVTGSRLIGGDPSAKVFVLTAQDIQRRGISSVEDIFRTLPWAYGSITTQTNMAFGPDASDVDKNLGALGLGTSTVNLRALGSANTLVLKDGRRLAGAAGDDDNFLNLLNLPLAAIDRVEIQLDGASAVYGSDAIGGVVNFITRKDYRGLSVTARNEWSGTNADRRTLDFAAGMSWDSGNVSGTLSRTEDSPIDNTRIWTSSDYRAEFGPEYDRRSYFTGQPGVACEWNNSLFYPGCDFRDPTRYQLDSGSGLGATIDDFTTDIKPWDFVEPQNGADSEQNALTLDFEQYVTDDLRVYAGLLISKRESFQNFQSGMSNYLIPASNAYNPFGRTMVVSYYPLRELQNGDLPWSYTTAETRQNEYHAGLYWELGDSHQLQLDFSLGRTRKDSRQSRSDYGAASRGGVFNPDAAAFYQAVDSSDPAVALNLFGDGTAQGANFAELLTDALGPSQDFTDKRTIKPMLRGELLEIWGGRIRYVVGSEMERREVYSHSLRWSDSGLGRAFGRETYIGVEKPEVKETGYFAELALPLVNAQNAMPAIAALNLSLQARSQSHEYTGAFGGVSSIRDFTQARERVVWVPGEGWQNSRLSSWSWVEQGTPNIVDEKRRETSIRLGIHYKPVDQLTLRVSYAEAYKPPNYGDLFDIDEPRSFTSLYVDPYDPDGRTGYIFLPTLFSGGNPNLENETSDTTRVVLDWNPPVAPGLTLTADWSKAEFINKIEYGSSILYNYAEIAFTLDNLVQRNADGYAVGVRNQTLNAAQKINETLDLYAEYTFSTRVGDFYPRLHYNRVLDEYFVIVPGSESVTRVGTGRGSNKYEIQASLSYLRGSLAVDGFVTYIPGYENDRTGRCTEAVGGCTRQYAQAPPLQVGSHTTVDLTVTYQFDNGIRVRGGARNIFDEELRTVYDRIPYDPTRYDARARVFFLEVNYELDADW